MSGIYIKGMEMPKPKLADMSLARSTVYYAYVLVSSNGHAAIVIDNEDGLDSTEYPLIPVPEHGRLIDADALRQDWLENGENEYVYDTYAFLDSLNDAPTIIPADKEGE